MITLRIAACTALLLTVLTASVSGAKETADSSVGSNLPPKIRGLLIQEMNAVLDATKNILDALVRGQDDIVAQKAQAIHDSFIMKQKMTEADRKALLNSVPEVFVQRDRAFHELSAQLAEAAREGDQARQQQLFAEMINACVTCHSRHALDRFPGLKNKPAN